ncbi:hypothetical protein [Pseudoalteromonas luteoviolacea]|uniref:hypothetical protein n=1 Tax=Pseudoalteromonas luteoviolacea TaxID=43657 RepID=UPI00114F5E03|nr:hypothetical protein [Pseudoalteromonas luteoviolacea]TQF70135.1 hypothetical protein FLM44_03310 [Pseudoalteromonas luteoviolacea]
MSSIPKLSLKFKTRIVAVFDLGLMTEAMDGKKYQLRVPEFTSEYQKLDRESKLHEVVGKTIFVYEFIENRGQVSQLSEAELKLRAKEHKKEMDKLQRNYKNKV